MPRGPSAIPYATEMPFVGGDDGWAIRRAPPSTTDRATVIRHGGQRWTLLAT